MKDLIASALSLLGILGVVSITPDGWFLDKIENLNSNVSQNSFAVGRATAEISRIDGTVMDIMSTHDADLQSIRNAVEDGQLQVEEYFNRLSLQIRIDGLEDDILETTNALGIEQAEYDRLDRINSGNAAAPPSEESLRSQERSQQRLSALNARLEGTVRELNRLMQ